MEEKRVDIQTRKEAAKKQMKEQEKAAAKGQGFSSGMMQPGFSPGPMFSGPPPNIGRPPRVSGAPPGPFGGPQQRGTAPRGPGPMDNQGPRFGGSGPRHFGPRGDARFHGPRGEMGDRGRGRGGFSRGRGGFGNMGRGFNDDQDTLDKVGGDTSVDHSDDLSGDDNNAILQKLYRDERTNKFVLNQITDEGKDILNQLGFEGRVFLVKFPFMSTAQLNNMVKFVNTLGDEGKHLHKTGTFSQMVVSRMKRDLIAEMQRIDVDISLELSNRNKVEGAAGRGRGGPHGHFGRGRGGSFQGGSCGEEYNQSEFDNEGGPGSGGHQGKGPVSLLDLNIEGPSGKNVDKPADDEGFDHGSEM